ncbi:MAG TPA: potassium channel family protein [Acidobacteriaceae bacterium]|nr:potassium channel family protein [Acidobacteriaceae bacterium]
MHPLGLIFGLLAIGTVLLDAFETIILPRRASGKIRLTWLFYLITWRPWSAVVSRFRNRRLRESGFSFYGPLSLLFLMGLWAVGLVFGFGLMFYGLGAPLHDQLGLHPLRTAIYLSGTTLFTLGIGDVTPLNHWARDLVIIEAGTGLGFVAVVIGYLPVLYQAFSRREGSIALLDGRAGSPPTVSELLRRHASDGGNDALVELLAEWERWSAEMLESHISYPLLCYFRSQHDNQSWLSAVTAILDTCAVLLSIVECSACRQARLTFAMARHTVVDLLLVFNMQPVPIPKPALPGSAPAPDPPKDMAMRLSETELVRLTEVLCKAGYRLRLDPERLALLRKLRWMYEGQVVALSRYLWMPLPPLVTQTPGRDTWMLVNNLLELYSAQPQATDEDTHAATLMARTREIFADEPHAF